MPPAWRAEGIGESAPQWPWGSLSAIDVDNLVIGGASVRVRIAVRRVRRQDGIGTSSLSGMRLGLMRVVDFKWRGSCELSVPRMPPAMRVASRRGPVGCVLPTGLCRTRLARRHSQLVEHLWTPRDADERTR